MASGREYSMLFRLNAELGSSYSSSFNGAKGPVLGLQTEINKLNKAQGDISAYQKQQGAIENTRQKLKLLQQQYDNIQKEMTETGDSSADMKNKLIAKQNQIDRTSNSLKNHSDKLNTMDAALDKAGISTKDLASESKRLDTQIDELKGSQEEAAQATNGFSESVSGAVQSLNTLLVSAGVTKLIYEGMKASAEAAIAFESAMAGVAKTSDLTHSELEKMGNDFQRMSTEIPVSANELAKIAETAGQLGIAEENIVSFTSVMAKLSTATTMSADEGATMLAQFSNIVQMDPKNYERLASTVVDLGNNYATTEQRIMDMSQGMAASADLVGMSEADILGLSAAISSLGIESQAGSSSASKLITELHKAVKTGKGLDDFARIAGRTGRDFSKAWGEDAAGALTLFIQGLNDTERNGKSAIEILEEMGITEVRTQRMMLSLANSGDLLNRSLATANGAWKANTALQVEANKRYGTTESKIIMANNAFDNLKVTIGEGLTPLIGPLADGFADIVTEITNWLEANPELRDAILTFGGVLAIGGAAIAGYTAIVTAAQVAMTLMKAAIPGIGWVAGGLLALGLVAGAYVWIKNKADEATTTIEDWSKDFTAKMDVIAENETLIGLGEEYQTLSEKIGGGKTAVDEYQTKQQALWDAWNSGDMPTDEYQRQLALLRTEYTNGITETGKYQTKEDELWKAFIGGEIFIDQYTKELDTIRAQHATDGEAVVAYKEQEAALWEAYTSGSMPLETYKTKLLALRQEYGFNNLSAGELASTEARLSQLKQELRDKSGGLITATDNETEAFNRQNAAVLAIREARQYEIRQDAYDSIVQNGGLYLEALQDEVAAKALLNEATAREAELETAVSAGIIGTQEQLRAIYNDISSQDPAWYADPANYAYVQQQLTAAEDLYNNITGREFKFTNISDLEAQLNNLPLDLNSTNAEASILELIKNVGVYDQDVQDANAAQKLWMDTLVYGVRQGGMELETLQGMLNERFLSEANGAQIVADIMTYVAQATQAAAGVSDMSAGLLSTEEQTVALATALNGTKEKMDELAAAYTKVYDSALASINGQLKLFEELKEPESTLTSDQMLNTLNQQAAYLDSYTANIKKATELGVAPELVKQLSDGSIESANYLQTIVDSGNTKIAELNTAFGKVSEGKETFATTLADIQTNFTTAMDTLQSQLAADVTAMNLNTDAAASGKSTVQGFIDGANSMLDPVKTAYAAIAAAAANALKIELDIESPSKVTAEIGKYTGMGLIQGALSQEEGFRRAMGDMADTGVEAYKNSGLLEALGSSYYERAGRIFVQGNATSPVMAASVSVDGNGRSAAPITIQVSPSYAFNGISESSQIKAALAKNNEQLERMILDVVDGRSLDLQRRRYDS